MPPWSQVVIKRPAYAWSCMPCWHQDPRYLYMHSIDLVWPNALDCIAGSAWNQINRNSTNGLVPVCSNSSALEMELLQFCTKPSIYFLQENAITCPEMGWYCQHQPHSSTVLECVLNYWLFYIKKNIDVFGISWHWCDPDLIHWGWETHICIGNLTNIGSDDNPLSDSMLKYC